MEVQKAKDLSKSCIVGGRYLIQMQVTKILAQYIRTMKIWRKLTPMETPSY